MSLQPLIDRTEDAYRRYREGRGRLDAAYRDVVELVDELEQLRLQNPHDVPEVFLDGNSDPFELAAALAYGQGLNREAFEHIERARGRSLLDRTLNRLPMASAVDPRLLQDEIEASRRVIELMRVQQAARLQGRPVDQPAEAALAAARARLLQVRASIRKQDAAYAAMRGVTPAALADVQALLDHRTALLAYGPTAERLLIFVVRSDGFWAEHVDIARTEITARIGRFRDLVDRFAARPRDILVEDDPSLRTGSAARIDERACDEVSGELHQLLIEPALCHLRGIDRLCIVPHHDLQLVPFQALRSDDGYLIERFAPWYAPSISLLDLCYQRQRQSRGRLLVLGNPDLGPERNLPFAEDEALAIGSMMGASALVRDQATLAAVNGELDRVDILHAACHAEWNAGQPEFSALLLTPGPDDPGRLEVQDLFRLERELPLSLVTLSACQTSLTAGSGLTGLAAGFLYAGAASVVASLWSVADFSTSELMIAFYRNLADMDRASALRAAQLALLQSERHAAPYHWAGFLLIGSPTRIDSERVTAASAFHFVHLWTFRSSAGRLAFPVADRDAIYAMCLPPTTIDRLAAPVSAELMAISLQDRRLIWQRRLDSSARPLCVIPGLVHVNAGSKVRAFRAGDGAAVWELATETAFSQELIVSGGLMYGGGKARVVRAIDPETGEIAWTYELPRPGSGGLVCGEGRVLAGCADHCIYALDARTGALQWTCDLEFDTWRSGPAWIRDGYLISDVGAFELTSGKRAGTRIGNVVLGRDRPPTTAAGRVPPGVEAVFTSTYVRCDADLTFVSTFHGQDHRDLTLFDTESGALLRRFSLESSSGIARAGDIVVVGDGDGHLRGFTIERFARNRERSA